MRPRVLVSFIAIILWSILILGYASPFCNPYEVTIKARSHYSNEDYHLKVLLSDDGRTIKKIEMRINGHKLRIPAAAYTDLYYPISGSFALSEDYTIEFDLGDPENKYSIHVCIKYERYKVTRRSIQYNPILGGTTEWKEKSF